MRAWLIISGCRPCLGMAVSSRFPCSRSRIPTAKPGCAERTSLLVVWLISTLISGCMRTVGRRGYELISPPSPFLPFLIDLAAALKLGFTLLIGSTYPEPRMPNFQASRSSRMMRISICRKPSLKWSHKDRSCTAPMLTLPRQPAKEHVCHEDLSRFEEAFVLSVSDTRLGRAPCSAPNPPHGRGFPLQTCTPLR